jgi:periplasmic protein TonB
MAAITTTSRDRLVITLFLAASLHAAIILGVGFGSNRATPPIPTIEVTLARHADLEAPERADFIAQTHQQGSGARDIAEEPTARTEVEFPAPEPRPVAPAPAPEPPPETREQSQVVTSSVSDAATPAEDAVATETAEPMPGIDTMAYAELAREIASLEARITEQLQAEANRPRVKRLTSVSAKSAEEAAYLNAWRQKVERIGNANYPPGGVWGSLRMLVVLRYDGALEEVRLLESSGHASLDEAALRIVRMAAPYQAFTVEMRKKYDRLEIIRTWQFSRSGARLGA